MLPLSPVSAAPNKASSSMVDRRVLIGGFDLARLWVVGGRLLPLPSLPSSLAPILFPSSKAPLPMPSPVDVEFDVVVVDDDDDDVDDDDDDDDDDDVDATSTDGQLIPWHKQNSCSCQDSQTASLSCCGVIRAMAARRLSATALSGQYTQSNASAVAQLNSIPTGGCGLHITWVCLQWP